MAAASIGMDLTFGVGGASPGMRIIDTARKKHLRFLHGAADSVQIKAGRATSTTNPLAMSSLLAGAGLWCFGTSCLRSTCSVGDLVDLDTVASLGIAPSCSWKNKHTVTIIFGPGGCPRWSSPNTRQRLTHYDDFRPIRHSVRRATVYCTNTPRLSVVSVLHYFDTLITTNRFSSFAQPRSVHETRCAGRCSGCHGPLTAQLLRSLRSPISFLGLQISKHLVHRQRFLSIVRCAPPCLGFTNSLMFLDVSFFRQWTAFCSVRRLFSATGEPQQIALLSVSRNLPLFCGSQVTR